jgi:alcohol dehydrogenase (NADP+)
MKFFTSLSVSIAFAQHVFAQVGPHFLPITPAKGTLLDGPPQLGLGTWYMRGNTSEAIAHAIERGYRHIDCAKIYGNQRDVGTGIALGIKRAGLTRQDIWVTSKLWNTE